jgi:hypothetical protein
MKPGKIAQQILANAKEASQKIIDDLPMHKKVQRQNAERIVAACESLITARPIQEPTSTAVEEVGKLRYLKFPATQSLLNRYAGILRIWRTAFHDIVDLTSPVRKRDSGELFIEPQSLQGVDAGTRAQIELILALLNEASKKVNRQQQIIRQKIPAPDVSADASSDPRQDLAPLKQWLNDLKRINGYLEVDAAGVRITPHARPRVIIMSKDVLDSISRICGL